MVMNSMIASWIVARLKEPSTYAGGGIISLVVHQLYPGSLGDSIVTSIAAVSGTIAMIMSEKKAA
jgi:hypothetical protein